MPPPMTFLTLLALAMNSLEPSSSEPTGHPRPLDKHTEMESKRAPRSSVVYSLLATMALKILAPSRCKGSPRDLQRALISLREAAE